MISPRESRRRQSKKDEAIRKKIETELSKKRGQAQKIRLLRKGAPGTVLNLEPLEPIVCKSQSTVYEAAQLMLAKRGNCILVVAEDGALLGIVTAKDLAFRVVAEGHTPTTPIEQIMTANPVCAGPGDPASEALELMVERGFRHLPVWDGSRLVGVLDITKLYAQQMERLERLHASNQKIHDALDSVTDDHPKQVLKYFQELRAKMEAPTLESVLDSSTNPVYITVKLSVYEAAVLMKEFKTTAVLVKDTNDSVSGIFTSKDVVLRVIAAGLDPTRCSVVRVMTPLPDLASCKLSIQQALRQMFDGHYLNLPVVDEDEIVGMVDVLRLTYATLSQIKKIETSKSEPEPAWSSFWTSLDDSESFQSILPDVNPSDSVSVNESFNESFNESRLSQIREDVFVFKFRTTARVHRVTLTGDLADLRAAIDSKLHQKDLEELSLGNEPYALSYVDDEGDLVSITTDSDLADCILVHRSLSLNKANLYIHNPHKPATTEKLRPLKTSGLSNQTLLSGALAVATGLAAVFYVTRK